MVRDMHSRRRLLAGTALTGVVALALAGVAAANPVNPTVVRGTVGFDSSGSVLDVLQGSDKAIIDWRGFDIAAGETTRFVQPGAGSIALNRVTGGQSSMIDGSLSANGRIFLINPNGILFGAGSVVDVGSLVATTADIANDRFIAGDYRFDAASAVAGATITNNGTITAGTGLAALVAPQVRNAGTIRAELGRVTLGAAQRFTLDLAGDGLISFDAGSAVNGAKLEQAGLVQGASVLLSASTAARVVDNVIDMTGIVQAHSVRQEGGDIVLDGGQGGVSVSGTLDAGTGSVRANTGLSLSGNLLGGSVTLAGPLTVGDLATIVTAGGANDSVSITGAIDGTGFLTIDAGTGSVNLGTVGAAQALAGLAAKGGTVALNGVRTSGRQDIAGAVTLSGDLVSTTGGAIRLGGPVTLASDSTIVTAGFAGDDVQVTGAINGVHALVADAGAGKVTLGGPVGATQALTLLSAGGSTVTLGAVTTTGLQDYAGTVTLSGDLVSTTGGSIRLGGPVTLAGNSALVTAGFAGDDIRVTGAVNGPYALVADAGAGKVTLGGPVGATQALTLLSAGGSSVTLGSVTTTGLQDYAGAVTLSGDLVSTTGGSIRLGGPVTLAGNSALVTAGFAGDDIRVTGAVNGSYALVADAGAGKVTLGGPVGATQALKLLSAGGSTVTLGAVTTTGLQDYAGTVTLAGDLVSTTGGSIRLGGPVTLAGDSAIVTAGAATDDIRITGAVNGAHGLLVDAGIGKVTLDGAVGAASALKLFSAGGSSVSLRDVTTTGQQDYAGAITLNGNLVSTLGGTIRLAGPVTLAGNSAIVTAGAATDDIRIQGAVDGAYALVADAGRGRVLLGGPVGATRALTLLSVGGASLTLGNVTTSGAQDYAGAVTLNGNLVSTNGGTIRIAGTTQLTGNSAIVTAGAATDDIRISGPVDGAYALVLDAGTARVDLAGAVGASRALSSFAAGGGILSLRGVTTSGLQDYAGALTLSGDLVSTLGGAIRVAGPVTLAGDSAIVTAGAATDDIRISGPVNGAYALVVDAGAGKADLAGAVGGTTALKLLSVGGSTVALRGVRTTGQQDYAGTITLNGDLTSLTGGAIRLGGPVTLAADSMITTAGSATDNVVVTGAVTGPYRLTVRAGTGAVGLGSAVTGLTGLDVAGGTVALAAPVSVTNALIASATRLTTGTLSAATVTLAGTDALTAGAITASQDVRVTAGKGATLAAITGRNATVTAGDALTTGAVTTTQDTTVTGTKAVTLGAVTARNLTATAGTSLTLAGMTGEGAVLSAATRIASTGTLSLSRSLVLETAGTATGLDVRAGALTYRGTGRFAASGTVAGVSGTDAADLIRIDGPRSGTYLFTDRPVFGVATLVERHRLDIPQADTVPADAGDVRSAPLVLDPALVKDDLISFAD